MADKLKLVTILGRAGALMMRDAVIVLGLIIALSVLGTVADASGMNVNAPFNIASVVIEYYVLRHAFQREGLVGEAGPGGFGGYFGLGLLTGIAILLGCLVLVLPGLYLAARWSAADGVLIAERRGVGDAMAESWRMTKGHEPAIALAIVIVWLPAVAGIALPLVLDDPGGNVSVALDAAMNVGLCVSMIAGWYVGAGTYALLADDAATLDAVFA